LSTDCEACPEEFVGRIFASEDSDFIQSTRCKQLKQYFLRERKFVALLWVRQTSLRLRQILREHTALARHSKNLDFQTELGIFLRYFYLRGLCGLLFVAISLAGPMRVRGMALRADALLQRFVEIRETLDSGPAAPVGRPTGSISA
jgi:hypothetical protein